MRLIDDVLIKPRWKAAITAGSVAKTFSLELLFEPLNAIEKMMSGKINFDDINPDDGEKALNTA